PFEDYDVNDNFDFRNGEFEDFTDFDNVDTDIQNEIDDLNINDDDFETGGTGTFEDNYDDLFNETPTDPFEDYDVNDLSRFIKNGFEDFNDFDNIDTGVQNGIGEVNINDDEFEIGETG
ncbi:hypothetical protein MHBO_004131, partial [Bonamia ostreae]